MIASLPSRPAGPPARPAVAASFVALFSALAQAGCAVVYPEIATRLSEVPEGAVLHPPPPAELVSFGALAAAVPRARPSGRSWESEDASLPDPFVVVRVEGREVFSSEPRPDTLTPSWRDVPPRNMELGGRPLGVELWEDNPLTDIPIHRAEIPPLGPRELADGVVVVEFEGGGRIELVTEPAQAIWGVGLFYEARASRYFVTRLLPRSPAARAKIQPGDEIVTIGKARTKGMKLAELERRFRTARRFDVKIGIERLEGNGGRSLEAVVREGPIYVTDEEFVWLK